MIDALLILRCDRRQVNAELNDCSRKLRIARREYDTMYAIVSGSQ